MKSVDFSHNLSFQQTDNQDALSSEDNHSKTSSYESEDSSTCF